MPKLTRNFLKGRMNKDLDERLVPKGEYRDAQNIQISTSESSDVGAIEAMLGNTKIANAPNSLTWTDNFGLTSPKVIGAARDTQNNKIYWFITSSASDVDAILEYDEDSNEVAPVIVDTRDGTNNIDPVLNFNVNYLVTGINIIDGMLFWTDDLNEPRKINIETFKAGSTGNTTSLNATTQVYRPPNIPPTPGYATRYFTDSDIAVAKKAPEQALIATAVASIEGGDGTGIDPEPVDANFYDKEVDDSIALTWSDDISWYNNSGTIEIVLTAEKENNDNSLDKFQVVGTFKSSPAATATSATINITSISEDIPNEILTWDMLLVEGEPIFKNDFPRFTYRYKFVDGEYSPYAPFSKVAFVPGEFKYLSRDGNNVGMESVIRKITLSNFEARPNDVDEVEVLYKGSRNNNVYLIHSFDFSPVITQQPLTLDITSGTLGRIIESSQLLRLFDPVPRKAKAQELIGNRVVYGNYLENYNIKNSSVRITADQTNSNHGAGNFGEETVKSDREYQIGVTFIDDYGRESPVFTSEGGAITVDTKNSKKTNTLKAKLSNFSAPSGISKFKYYVKDSSAEYYNLALDRYYEDKNEGVWLSFPSSERNKVSENQYIRLKKEHDNSNAVNINNKFKILSISNEAPEVLTNIRKVKARAQIKGRGTHSDSFEVGDNRITFNGPLDSHIPVDSGNKVHTNKEFVSAFQDLAYIQFQNNSGTAKSSVYRIESGGPTGEKETINNFEYGRYEVLLTENLKSADAWLTQLANDADLKAVIFKEERQALPEFSGRFFVKINPDAVFKQHIVAAFKSTTPELIEGETITVSTDSSGISSNTDHEVMWSDTYAPVGEQKIPASGSYEFRLLAARIDNSTSWEASTAYQNFYKDISEGSYIKFEYSDGTFSDDFYQITSKTVFTSAYNRNSGSDGVGTSMKFLMNRELDDTSYSGSGGAAQFSKIKVYRERLTPDKEEISSTNPAVFETEPIEIADLDLYYEASDPINISNIGTNQNLDFFNAYSFGNGVESDRIRDDFNAPVIGNGVRVSSIIEEPYKEERRGSGMIFSGIINSRSGINESNQFLIAQDITKDLNPIHGTIQKLSSRGAAARGDLIALCEDKVFKILANKDALFNADGNTNLTATKNVLGQAIPFAGEYGISTQPESFASFGFRSYFCDRNRRAVLRLSADGLTVISDKGLRNYFGDSWTAQLNKKVFGGYDEYTDTYHARVQNQQVIFSENVNGWITRTSWVPEYSGISLNNNYYTFKNGELYIHNNAIRNNIYGAQQNATVTAVLNDAPTAIKNFKTLEYQGDAGWSATLNTDQEKGLANLANFVKREGLYQTYIQGVENTWNDVLQSGDIDFYSLSILGIGEHSGSDVSTVVGNNTFEFVIDIDPAISIGDKLYYQDGNNIINLGDITAINRSSSPRTIVSNIQQLPAGSNTINTGEFIFAAKDKRVNTSGIIGYYADVTFTNTSSDKSELFGIGSEVFISSE